MKTFTQEQVIEILKKKQGKRTAREFARELGFSANYIHYVLTGKQEPSSKLLALVGMRKEKTVTVTYFEMNGAKR